MQYFLRSIMLYFNFYKYVNKITKNKKKYYFLRLEFNLQGHKSVILASIILTPCV